MSIPQKMLMIHPTMITAVSIWISAAATLSQNTQQTPRSEIRSLRAPHSTVNAEMKVPVGQTPEITLLPTTIQEVILLRSPAIIASVMFIVQHDRRSLRSFPFWLISSESKQTPDEINQKKLVPSRNITHVLMHRKTFSLRGFWSKTIIKCIIAMI